MRPVRGMLNESWSSHVSCRRLGYKFGWTWRATEINLFLFFCSMTILNVTKHTLTAFHLVDISPFFGDKFKIYFSITVHKRPQKILKIKLHDVKTYKKKLLLLHPTTIASAFSTEWNRYSNSKYYFFAACLHKI